MPYMESKQIFTDLKIHILKIILKIYVLDDISGDADFSAEIKDYILSLKLKYNYFAQNNGDGEYIYKENRFTNNIDLSKDFLLKDNNKVRFVSQISYFISDIYLLNKNIEKVYNIDALIKGIFCFDKIVFHGGARLQNFNFYKNYFRVSPFFSINYDMLPSLALYGVFKPEMSIPDYVKKANIPFLIANEDLKPSFDSTNIETGINLNIFNLNNKLYYGYKSIKDYIYIDELERTNIFSFYNGDLTYWFAGIKIENIKTESVNVIIGYEFKDIIDKTKNVTYFPKNSLKLLFNLKLLEWEFNIKTYGETIKYGTVNDTIAPYLNIDLILTKIINSNFSIYGYINNLLNNTDYLLYYYREKGFNLGIGTLIKF